MKKACCLLLALALLCAALPAFAAETAELGKPFHDFTVTTIDGEEFTLSEALKTHEAVYVNLFATWCPPCKMEFPFMQQVYQEYSDRVAVIVISIETNDTPDKLRAYREENGLTLPMAPAGSDWMAMYTEAYSIPVSMMIDRFGNLTLREAGAVTDADSFRRMFDAFLGEGYTATRTYQGIPAPVLSIEFPSDEALSEALNAEESEIAFTSDPTRHDYPFVPVEQAGAVPSNLDVSQSIASCQTVVTAKKGSALTFDLCYDLAIGLNYLNVELDGAVVKQFMGSSDGRTWTISLPKGEHEVRFVYDQWQPQETGAPVLSGVRLLSGYEAREALKALPVYPTFDTTDMIVSGGINGYFEYMGQPALAGCVVNEDTVDIELTVTDDFDPESVMFLDTMNPDHTLLLSSMLTEDGTGYRYRMMLSAESGHYAAAVMEALQPRITLQMLVMHGEIGVEQVIADYAQRGYALTWVPNETPEAENEATYTVHVVDQNGDPVPGAYINFCTDDSCTPTQADENGVIIFTGTPVSYHLQILKLPDGYSFDPAFEAYTEPHTSEMTVTVNQD